MEGSVQEVTKGRTITDGRLRGPIKHPLQCRRAARWIKLSTTPRPMKNFSTKKGGRPPGDHILAPE